MSSSANLPLRFRSIPISSVFMVLSRQTYPLMPVRIVLAVSIGYSVAEVFVVIFDVSMVQLQPDAGDIDRVHVGWKAPVRLIDVRTNVAGAVDNIAAVVAGFR